jgi:hypothetical protein
VKDLRVELVEIGNRVADSGETIDDAARVDLLALSAADGQRAINPS